ncbi:MAG TPA: lysophospholipid acyltransferase family protein [Thermoanaerobaculia bacterium]|nr:lysophospholipid acyltransferase family protein [Thermoanaerobaculia bacterium]
MGAQLLSRAAGAALSLHRATLKTRRVHFDRYLALKARGVPILFALWHGRMFLSIQAHRREGIVTMASRSKDGEIIAGWLERNGYGVVRGSSTRGGSEALRQMVRRVRAGAAAALTVDGPTGPPRVVQPGIVHVARLTGGWILPITFSSDRPRFLASWDRYLVPLPFSENVVLYGEPFPVPKEAGEAEALERVARALDGATEEADGLMGVTPPEVWTRPGNRPGLDSGSP